jgi:transcriptional regulator GlxA family with amidase domain
MGTRHIPNMKIIHPFLLKVVPKLRYLLTVCTGSALVAQTGLLDHRKATSNKRSWSWVIAQGPNVNWVGKARWVVDEPASEANSNILSSESDVAPGAGGEGEGVSVWTSSGIAAGMDMTFAWVKNIYGEKIADQLANSLEYERHEDSEWDPYSEIWGVVGKEEER